MATNSIGAQRRETRANRHQWALGPGSVTWKVLRDPVVFLVGMGRTTLVLSLHPPFASSSEHDTFYAQPMLRFRKIAMYAYGTAFGTCEDADRVANMVRTRHAQVTGVDTITQRPYQSYSEYELAITHIIQTLGFLLTYEEIYGRLSDDDRSKFFMEQKIPSAMIGIKPDHMPSTYNEAIEQMSKIRLRFAITATARQLLSHIDSSDYTAGAALGDLPPVKRTVATLLIRSTADMARLTLDPEDDELISFKRKPYLRSRFLVRTSLKLYSWLFRTKKLQKLWHEMLSTKIAESYRRALQEEDSPGAEERAAKFVIPDAWDHFVELPYMKKNWPGDMDNYALGSELEGPVQRGSITELRLPGSALRPRMHAVT